MKKDKEQSICEFYKTFYKANKPVILVAIIFLALLPISLYILACTPSSIGFMSHDDAIVWLTYYGAIAGGGMTLCGVAWTISNQRKYRESDLRIQFRPILAMNGNPIIRDKHLEYNSEFYQYYLVFSDSDQIKRKGNNLLTLGAVGLQMKVINAGREETTITHIETSFSQDSIFDIRRNKSDKNELLVPKECINIRYDFARYNKNKKKVEFKIETKIYCKSYYEENERCFNLKTDLFIKEDRRKKYLLALKLNSYKLYEMK